VSAKGALRGEEDGCGGPVASAWHTTLLLCSRWLPGEGFVSVIHHQSITSDREVRAGKLLKFAA
jgi:hypothetical protein